MSVGEWLDATFTLYRRNFALIASISAVVQIPYALLTWLLFEITGVATFVRSPFASLGAQTITQAQAQQLLNSYLGVLAVTLGLLLVSLLVVVPLGEAATTRAVSDRYLDRPSSLLAAYRAAWSRLGALIAMILHPHRRLRRVPRRGHRAGPCCSAPPVPAALGALLAVVAIIALDPGADRRLRAHGRRRARDRPRARRPAGAACSGAGSLISGRFWPTFGRMLLLGLIASIISSVVAAIFELPGSGTRSRTTRSSSIRWRVRSRRSSSARSPTSA